MSHDRKAQHFRISYKGVHLCFVYARSASIAIQAARRTYKGFPNLPEQLATGDNIRADLSLLVARPTGYGCASIEDTDTDDFHTCS